MYAWPGCCPILIRMKCQSVIYFPTTTDRRGKLLSWVNSSKYQGGLWMLQASDLIVIFALQNSFVRATASSKWGMGWRKWVSERTLSAATLEGEEFCCSCYYVVRSTPSQRRDQLCIRTYGTAAAAATTTRSTANTSGSCALLQLCPGNIE